MDKINETFGQLESNELYQLGTDETDVEPELPTNKDLQPAQPYQETGQVNNLLIENGMQKIHLSSSEPMNQLIGYAVWIRDNFFQETKRENVIVK
jgi:hypothetical protein